MPKVSFILPAYKRRFLYKAISSILDQTYNDFELIVVDDASPENLKGIIDSFKDNRLLYRRNLQNIGRKDLVAAWNIALSYASGEYIVCAGDDDVYMPDFLQEMIRLSSKYPKCDVFHCRVAYIDANAEIYKIRNPRAEYENGIQMIYHSCVERQGQFISDFMYRKEKLLEIGGFVYAPKAWYSDIMTAIQLSLANGAAYSSKILLKWRSSGENITTKLDDVPEKIEAGLLFRKWIYKIICNLSPKNNDDLIIFELIKLNYEKNIYFTIHYYWSQVRDKEACKVLENSGIENEIKIKWKMEKKKNTYGILAICREIRSLIRYGKFGR